MSIQSYNIEEKYWHTPAYMSILSHPALEPSASAFNSDPAIGAPTKDIVEVTENMRPILVLVWHYVQYARIK